MAQPSIVPEIQALLEPWLEKMMRLYDEAPETRREPTLPATPDGKINVRAVARALGLKTSQEQHFYKRPVLTSAVNAAAEAQGLLPIGSRLQSDQEDAVARKRMGRVTSDRDDLARTLAEREALIERLRAEIMSLREQLDLRADVGMTLRTGDLA